MKEGEQGVHEQLSRAGDGRYNTQVAGGETLERRTDEICLYIFFFQAEDGIRDIGVTGVQTCALPILIVHATQFFEFIKRIADDATDGNTVRLAPVLIQPMAAEDVASAVGRIPVGSPVNGIVEVAGAQQFRLAELIPKIGKGHD